MAKICFGFALVASFVSAEAFAIPYKFVTIDVPSAVYTEARDINESEQIVGTAIRSDSRFFAFVRDTDGTITTFTVPEAVDTVAETISDSSEIAGTFFTESGAHGFVRNKEGVITTIDVPGASETAVHGINNVGQIVGSTDGSFGRGFVRDPDGTITFIDLDAIDLDANGINNVGAIAGSVHQRDFTRVGFLRDASANISLIGTDPPSIVEAHDINDAGIVVGHFMDRSFPFPEHGFVRNANGDITSVDFPGALDTLAFGINNAGYIVGRFDDTEAGGTGNHGFLAIPVPEPSTVLLLACGVAGLGVWKLLKVSVSRIG
jgi:uncharacterized membrane protein